MYTAKNNFIIKAVCSSDHTLLDVGCGTGANAAAIKSKFPKIKVVGINHNEEELDIAKNHLDIALSADLNDPKSIYLNDKFDLIACSHVLEHLIDPKQLLELLAKSLNDDGRILVVVPNFGIWSARFKVLFGGFSYEESGLFDRTHLRFFTYFNLVEEVVPPNLKISARFQGGHFPLPVLRTLLPVSVIKIIDSFALTYFPNLFSSELCLELVKV